MIINLIWQIDLCPQSKTQNDYIFITIEFYVTKNLY